MGLGGKVAIVTGSTSGIGLGIARALAQDGASVMMNGFGNAAEIEALRGEIAQKFGVEVLHSAADMTRPDEITAMVADAKEAWGRVDVLVNNAGIQHTALIEAFPHDRWEAVISINLSAAFYAMQAVIPVMKGNGWGRIINIASAHGLVASAQKAAYVAAKHGLVGLTKTGAIELANTGITCNAICPGWVLTPLVQKQIEARAAQRERPVEAERQALLAEKQPMLQFTSPEQIGALCVFLCSDAAATMSGAPLSIDGGWTAG